MKKTIVGIMTIVAMLVAILGTKVNAATSSIDKKDVKKGETVTITVTTNAPVKAVQYDIAFDGDNFEIVSGATKRGNLAKVSKFAIEEDETIPSTSVTFRALEDVPNAKFTIQNEGFSTDGSNKGTETITNEKEYVVNEGTETPDPTDVPEDPTPTAEPTAEPTEAPKTTEKPSNNNGLKYPQTGAPVYAYVAGIALVIIVAGAVLAVRKNK